MNRWPSTLAFVFLITIMQRSSNPSVRANADEVPSSKAHASNDAISPTTGLARCTAQALTVAPTPPVTTSLPNAYDTDPTSDFNQATASDSEDPSLWSCLLQTPPGIVRLNIHFLLDGEPYRTLRERWIDTALADSSPPPATEPANGATEKDRIVARLRNFQRENALKLTRPECRQLLLNWLNGPAVLVAHPSSNPRGSSMPLWQWLDRDENARLDAMERSSLAERLQTVDRNADGCIHLSDLQRVLQTSSQPTSRRDRDASAKVERHWKPTSAQLLQPIGATSDQSVIATLACIVDWRLQDGPSHLTLLSFDPKQEDLREPIVTDGETIVISLPGCDLELSFVVGGTHPSTDSDRQFTVGAELDGFPLWRRVDQDQDGRLTPLEIQTLDAQLDTLDADRDGQICAEELPVPVRLVFAAGTMAHVALQNPRSSPRRSPVSAPATSQVIPDWFQTMDINRDNILIRSEFLGTDEQFQQMDRNSDQRLDSHESVPAEASTP